MKTKIDSVEMLDALADEAARYEVEEGKPTVESLAAATRYRTFIDDRLAAMRRADLDALGSHQIERRGLRADLLALGRDALISRLSGMYDRYPVLGFAHRSLKDITDDDLRAMIQDAESAMEHVS